jgi:S-DNA-T family DNA segregation ATPase FtsK/SpoIIIE
VSKWKIIEKPGRKQKENNKISQAKEEIAKKLLNMRRQVEERKMEAAKSLKKEKKPESGTLRQAKSVKTVSKTGKTAPVSAGNTGQKLEYKMPGVDIFQRGNRANNKEKEQVLKSNANILENTLLEFGVEANVVKINPGPVITMYELEPAMGTRLNKVTSLTDNISLALKSANIRILAPIPGKGTIGIEVPNHKSELVMLRDVIETGEYSDEPSPLRFALGKDVAGDPIVPDLASMPHLLIAGATGSGKTVCINAIISSYLYNASPDEVKFLMIDPKRVELMMYEGIPHLISPIVTNPKKAASSLNWVVTEMERRYEVLAGKGVRNIGRYKERMTDKDENLPYIVVIVDELADLMMVAQQDVEATIMRIAQLARAAGIHLILATQRPSVNVITGVIKANFPARISFKVASKVDSRTVLDANGAEKLLGKGDMLLMEPGETSLIRGQCCYVDDREIKDLVKFVKQQTGPQYIEAVVAKQEKKYNTAEQEVDELFDDALQLLLDTEQASVSMLQRKFRIGYTRAARIIDVMEEKGVVGPYNGSKPREILIESIDELKDYETEENYEQNESQEKKSDYYEDDDNESEEDEEEYERDEQEK